MTRFREICFAVLVHALLFMPLYLHGDTPVIFDTTTVYAIGFQLGSAACVGSCDLSPTYNRYATPIPFKISKITFNWSNPGGNNCDGFGNYGALISSSPNASEIAAKSVNAVYVGCAGFSGTGTHGTGELDFSGQVIPSVFYLDFASFDGGLQGGAAVNVSGVEIWQEGSPISGQVWTIMTPPLSPSARTEAAMAYDKFHHQILLFGGQDASGGLLGDTWTWDGLNWTQMFPSNSPPAKVRSAMAYDDSTNQIVLFGGETACSGPACENAWGADTWAWDGVNWTRLFPASNPPPRYDHAMSYDAARQQIVLFGGADTQSSNIYGDTWTWDGGNWIQKSPTLSPSPRVVHAMTYDWVHQNVILFGGETAGISGFLQDQWTWDGVNWTQQVPQISPPAKGGHSLVYDAEEQVAILFGGVQPPSSSGVLIDTWLWDGTIWTQQFPPVSPSLRTFQSAAYDFGHSQVVLFGGNTENGPTPLGDTWVWGLASSIPISPEVQLSPTSINFPNQQLSTTSASATVTVTNIGNAGLNITSEPSISGANAADFAIAAGTTCTNGTSVPPGSSCVINVTFTPSTTVNAESATLSIHDTAPGSQTIQLNGTGQAPLNSALIVTSVSLSQAAQGTSIPLFIINGANFSSEARVAFSGSQDITVTQFAVNSFGQQIVASLQVSAAATLGPHDLIVTNPDTQSATYPGALTILATPPPPQNVSATVGNQTVILYWSAPQSVPDGYNVYVDQVNGTTTQPLGKLNDGLVQTTLLSVSNLPDGSILKNGQMYRFTIKAVAAGHEGDPGSVLAEPNVFTAPQHPLHPILFLHGIDSDASTWYATTNFLNDTLHWAPGGTLSYGPNDDPLTGTGPASDAPILTSSGDYFLVNFGNHFANYNVGSQGITHQGDEVAGFVQYIQSARSPGTKLTVVAHSMGGLAARSYIQTFTDSSTQVSDLITLGTPHWGVHRDVLIGAALGGIEVTRGLLLVAWPDMPQVLVSQGLSDMDGGCVANGDSTDETQMSRFLQGVDHDPQYPLPATIRYVVVSGTHLLVPDTCTGGLGLLPGESIVTDLVVPVTSSQLARIPPSTEQWFALATNKIHTDLTSDIPSILCGLDQHCLLLKVMSPVDIQVTAPNGQLISNSMASIPGAEYMDDVDENGHTTAVVVIPFPQGGRYAITATPKPGAAPTDTFTILQIQDGITTAIAQDMQIKDIPPSGFQASVKTGMYQVSVGGSVQMPLTKTANGSFIASVIVTNNGNVTIDSAQIQASGTTLGSGKLSTLPVPITNLVPGASATVTLVFPPTSVSATATSAPMKISGTYSAGSLAGNWGLSFRSVALK